MAGTPAASRDCVLPLNCVPLSTVQHFLSFLSPSVLSTLKLTCKYYLERIELPGKVFKKLVDDDTAFLGGFASDTITFKHCSMATIDRWYRFAMPTYDALNVLESTLSGRALYSLIHPRLGNAYLYKCGVVEGVSWRELLGRIPTECNIDLLNTRLPQDEADFGAALRDWSAQGKRFFSFGLTLAMKSLEVCDFGAFCEFLKVQYPRFDMSITVLADENSDESDISSRLDAVFLPTFSKRKFDDHNVAYSLIHRGGVAKVGCNWQPNS